MYNYTTNFSLFTINLSHLFTINLSHKTMLSEECFIWICFPGYTREHIVYKALGRVY
mgnify:FL=1